MVGLAPGQGVDVHARGFRDQGAAHHAMGDREEGAQGRRQAMHRPKPHLGKRDARKQGGIGHGGPVFGGVAGSRMPGQQGIPDLLHAGKRQGVGKGIGLAGDMGLQ
jgi:hypothetical protein